MLKYKYMDFKTFEAKLNTEEWEAPEYLVKPADDDKVFFFMKDESDKNKEKKKNK